MPLLNPQLRYPSLYASILSIQEALCNAKSQVNRIRLKSLPANDSWSHDFSVYYLMEDSGPVVNIFVSPNLCARNILRRNQGNDTPGIKVDNNG